MNTKKHKNKKVNRHCNLNIPQQDDTKISDTRTDTQISHTECDTKGESVQDKTNDGIQQVDERHEAEFIAPKKPKRKKGKKKEITEDECENGQDKLLQTNTVEKIAVVETENVRQDLPEVIPVRKKKNKKKDVVVGSENTLSIDQSHDGIQLVVPIDIESKIDKTHTNLPKIEMIEEIKIAKRKNKKKKRTDSEKSDKSVEILSCTSAFQKLLDVDGDDRSDDNIKELDLEFVTKNKSNTSGISQVGSEIKCEENSKNFEKSKPIVELKTEVSENVQGIEDDNNNENDNMQSSKTINLFEENQNDSQKQSVDETAEIILASVDIVSDSGTKCEFFSIEEDGLKRRAKIVKPVEKRGKKEGQEFQVKSSTEDTSYEIESQGPFVEEIFENIAIGNASKEKLEVPDVAKTVFDITKQTILEEDIQKGTVGTSSDEVKDELIFESLVSPDFASESSEDKLNEILNTITEPTQNNKNKKLIKTDCKELSENNEKPRKKGKKTPKILINPGMSATTIDMFEEREHIKSSDIDDKTLMLTPNEDIEIRSVKADESEGSTCDITPEILHPRSTSENLRDDNNNTVIQEVFEDTLNIPLSSEDIPLIQGSGETPTDIPETISSGIKLVEIENISTNLKEKTDIKSKMMEVNKDMEELRSSIEKSLAELTALQKNEDISEKQLKEKNELGISNKNVTATNDIILDYTVLNASDSHYEHTVDEVTVPIQDENISEKDAKSTEYHDAEKSSVHIDQLNFKEIKHQDKDVDETSINNDLIKDDNTDIIPPICPVRKDHKKGKKRKGRQETSQISNIVQSTHSHISTQDTKNEEKSQESTETSEQKGKQQTSTREDDNTTVTEDDHHYNKNEGVDYEPIEKFEDALTSSADDINKTFEMIVNQVAEDSQQELAFHKPEINIIEPSEETEKKGVEENPVTPPKNLLGHPDIPVRSNKTDYKKEKDKSPDTKQAKVKIKDNVEIEINKESKESQTEKKKEEKPKKQLKDEEYFCQISNCDDFIYKYSFRKVFLQSACHVCKKELTRFRVPCKFCSLIFYCSLKHKDDDWPKHQALCFAVSTIVHIKGQKHIYADAKNITGHNYRLLRMQAILGCEKVLKRRLIPWEQEVLLYPRMCADVSCREWRQSKLKDCEGCGQISYCSANADHLPKSHQRWCKSYSLYQKLVLYQQTKGRLEPKLPSRVIKEYQMPEKINEVLATMFEEKIDLNDVQYAALTQIATAPLTVAFCDQIYRSKKKYTTIDKNKMSSFAIHVVGAELQFEADVLNKWEIFFLHLRSDVKELRVVLVSPDLNPGKLPLDLLGRIRLCENCRQNKRRVVFNFQDNKTYQEYRNSDDFIYPDIDASELARSGHVVIAEGEAEASSTTDQFANDNLKNGVCAFNSGLHRASVYNGKDPWPATINAVVKLKCPFVITSHTVTELNRDLVRLKEFAELELVVGPRPNPYSSVRPDRNFISDDERNIKKVGNKISITAERREMALFQDSMNFNLDWIYDFYGCLYQLVIIYDQFAYIELPRCFQVGMTEVDGL